MSSGTPGLPQYDEHGLRLTPEGNIDLSDLLTLRRLHQLRGRTLHDGRPPQPQEDEKIEGEEIRVNYGFPTELGTQADQLPPSPSCPAKHPAASSDILCKDSESSDVRDRWEC